MAVGAALVTVAALSIGSLVVLAGTNTTPAPRELTQDDLARLGELNLGPVNGAPPISVDQAFQVAEREYAWDKAPGTPTIEAALASLSIPASDGMVEAQPVWVIHISGIEQAVAGPWTPEGPLPGRTLRNAYVFIDADSGEFLMTSWTE